MIVRTDKGLYCPAGDFYIDPHRAVPTAVITHAHSDHARRGMGLYIAHEHCLPLLRHRLNKSINTQSLQYNEPIQLGKAIVSLHPSGHMLGAAQVRVEVDGEVWVVTGDYKREPDPLAEDFQVVHCDTFITECTFGLPIYRWPHPNRVTQSINAWWRRNASRGIVSVIQAYSLGKAQRIALSVDHSIGPVYASQHVYNAHTLISQSGHYLPPTPLLTRDEVLARIHDSTAPIRQALVIASGGVDSALSGIPYAVASASGWTLVRKFRQHQQGFPVSDHADWPGLLQTVADTRCSMVLAVHGFTGAFTRYLREHGYDAHPFDDHDGGRGLGSVDQYTSTSWLVDACIAHVGSASEVNALLNASVDGDHSSRGLQSATAAAVDATRNTAEDSNDPASDPVNDSVNDSVSDSVSDPVAVSADVLHVHCVLMHLHASNSTYGFSKLTMGVWKHDVLVPLVHVGADVDDDVLSAIKQWAVDHTMVEAGPVRTLEPRFVFELSVGGILPAPRRKSGVKIATARIVRLVSTTASDAHTLDDFINTLDGA